MKNHKWKDITDYPYSKVEKCIKCGIERNWEYGDMSCWEYIDYRLQMGGQRTTYHRPSCTPILSKEITDFSREGKYI